MCLGDKIMALFLFFVTLSVTDFIVIQYPFITIIMVVLLLVLFFLQLDKEKYRIYLKKSIVIYFFSYNCCLGLFLVSSITPNPNSLLVMPFVAYLTFILLLKKDKGLLILDYSLKLFLIVLIVVAIIELFVKFGILELPFYENFLLNVGEKRLDVFRVRTLFGSSLSVSAICIVLMIYFMYLKKSLFFIVLNLLLILLSGSRTPIVISVILFIGYFISKSNFFTINKKNIFIIIVSFFSVPYFLYYLVSINERMLLIFSRGFDIAVDDSVRGREDTTIKTFLLILENFPNTLFGGLKEAWVSDSAFISIMATSGIIITILYLVYIVYLIKNIQVLKSLRKSVIILCFLLAGFMVGDLLIPASSYCLFLILFIYVDKKTQRIKYESITSNR